MKVCEDLDHDKFIKEVDENFSIMMETILNKSNDIFFTHPTVAIQACVYQNVAAFLLYFCISCVKDPDSESVDKIFEDTKRAALEPSNYTTLFGKRH